MPTTDDPIEPLTNVAKAARAVGEPLGFVLRMFLAEPNLDGGPHRARIVYNVDADKIGEGTVDDTSASLEAMWEATAAAEEEAQRAKARASLTSLEETLRDPKKGILDD